MLGESWVVVVVFIYTVVETSLPLFILEMLNHRQGIDGFEIVAHVPNANDISKNAKEILAKKNKKVIEVLLASGVTEYFDESKFEKEYAKNFTKYFETSAQKDPLMIPWKMMPESFTTIVNTMNHWCKNTNNEYERIKGLVLHSFFILKHAYRHGFTKEMLQDYIKIENYPEAPITVVYNPHERALLLLRKAASENRENDLALAFNDLKLFILLFHDVLANSGIKVIPLVVTDQNVNEGNLDCLECMGHVLSEEEFKNIHNFNTWLINTHATGRKININETLSKTFLAKITGVLSVALLHRDCTPMFTDEHNLHLHMEQLTVLLTPEQLDVYYSEQKHMIIKGGFGCGKSIIAAAMLQKISESLKEYEKLFYVCYDSRSELLNKMVKMEKMEKMVKMEKVVPFLNKKNLKFSKIIEHITKTEGPGKKISLLMSTMVKIWMNLKLKI